MAFLKKFKALLVRVLFGIHAFIAVWKAVELRRGRLEDHWYLLAPILLQAVEGIVSICSRKGEEMKWFCPSVFLYLVSVVPPIWLMELQLIELELRSRRPPKVAGQPEESVDIVGLRLNLDLRLEDWVLILEQLLLVILLIGRWLLPKGELTRDQLSQLLLAYMAMAADIIELFECFKEEKVASNKELILATLAIWSWSLLQFTLVLSSAQAPKPRLSITSSYHSSVLEVPETCSSTLEHVLDMDIISILTTVLMQDGPFFLLRVILIFRYQVVSYMNIFFTCKNTLVVSLQLYRLSVLICQKCKLRQKLVRIFL
ncbi:transmembrane protein 26-like [Oratosquilla oratoria]|uniref:transmembrane protein 26-like n=1 Tax=Oratosquilla oratoria TaxID=337810 RepID=UPI003F7613D9